MTIGATIPVAQYANLSPSFEAEGDTIEEAWANGLRQLKQMWDSVSPKPLQLQDAPEQAVAPTAIDLTCWASGTTVKFDPVQHVYGTGDWLSGSTFAGQYTPEFVGKYAAGKMADKHGVDPAEILAMWALNAEASSLFGSAVHAAVQLHGTYLELSKTVKGTNESALSKNPTLRPIVLAFFEGREDERAVYEAFVADPKLKHCGQIDRLLLVDRETRTIRVQDFKTNHDLGKKKTVREPFKGVIEATELGLYWLQLSFYAAILQRYGFIVEGLDIFHWDGSTWVEYSSPVIDLSEVI